MEKIFHRNLFDLMVFFHPSLPYYVRMRTDTPELESKLFLISRREKPYVIVD